MLPAGMDAVRKSVLCIFGVRLPRRWQRLFGNVILETIETPPGGSVAKH